MCAHIAHNGGPIASAPDAARVVALPESTEGATTRAAIRANHVTSVVLSDMNWPAFRRARDSSSPRTVVSDYGVLTSDQLSHATSLVISFVAEVPLRYT